MPATSRLNARRRSGAAEEAVWGGLWAVVHALIHHTQRNARSLGLTLPQCWMLRVLSVHGPVTAGALARELDVTLPTITSAVKHLERTGYVRRSHSSDDRRQVVVTLTPTGQRRLARFRKDQAAEGHALLLSFTSRERATLEELLGRLGKQLSPNASPHFLSSHPIQEC